MSEEDAHRWEEMGESKRSGIRDRPLLGAEGPSHPSPTRVPSLVACSAPPSIRVRSERVLDGGEEDSLERRGRVVDQGEPDKPRPYFPI